MPRALRSTHNAPIRAALPGPDGLLCMALMVGFALVVLSWPTMIHPTKWAIGGAGGDFAGFSWLLLHSLGVGTAGRWAGAVSFSFSPVLMSGVHNGNPDVTPIFFLPLCAWMAARVTRSRGWAVGAGLALGLSVWCNPYVAVMSGVIALAVAFGVRPVHPGRMALATSIALALGGAFVTLVFHSLDAPDAAMAKTIARPATAGVAHLLGYLWPTVQDQPHPWFVHSWYLGLVGLALTINGLRNAPTRWPWLTAGGIGLVLSLGPVLPITDSLAFAGGDDTGAAWMPGYWLRRLPGLDSLQIVYRYAALPALTVAVFAGFGVDRLGAKTARWAAVALVAVDLLLVLPGGSLIRPGPVLQTDACNLLKNLPDGPVINLPPTDDERWMLEQTCHRRAVAQGINRLGHRQVREVLRREPSQILKGLRQLGFRYLLVHTETAVQEHALLPPRPENERTNGLTELAEVRGLVAARSAGLVVVDLAP
jgi:hypothetical protein